MTRRNGDHSRDDMPRYSVLSPDGAPGRERDWRERASECRCEVVVRSSSELGRNSLRWRTRAQSCPLRPIPNVVPDRPGPSLLLLLCSSTSLLVCSAFGLPSGPSELPSSLKSRVPPGRCIQSTQPDISAASVGAGARCDAMRLKRVVSQPQWEQEFAYLFCRPEDPSFPRAFPSSFFRQRPPPPSPPPEPPGLRIGLPTKDILAENCRGPPFTPFPLPDGEQTSDPSPTNPKDGHRCRISQPVIVRRCDALVCRTVHIAQSRLVLRASSPPCECSRSLSCHGQPWSLRAAPDPSSRARPDVRPVKVSSCRPPSQLASGTQAPVWQWPTQTSRLHLDRRILSPLLVLPGRHPQVERRGSISAGVKEGRSPHPRGIRQSSVVSKPCRRWPLETLTSHSRTLLSWTRNLPYPW